MEAASTGEVATIRVGAAEVLMARVASPEIRR